MISDRPAVEEYINDPRPRISKRIGGRVGGCFLLSRLISGRSEYVPCTEAGANSLLKVGCLDRGRFPFLVCSLAFSMVFGQKCLGDCR